MTGKTYTGQCLCGHIAYRAVGDPINPHLCSCKMCQRWSGAPTVAWVDFEKKDFAWTGPGGEPAFCESSENTVRGFCPKCGGTLCAIDEGSDTVGITIATLDAPDEIIPGKQHSFEASGPVWWISRIDHDAAS